MTENNRKHLKRWIFPAGIFLLLFIAEAIIGAGAVFSYFYFQGKRDIEQIEKYTLNYSSTLAEAFASVAELSYKTKKYNSLKILFHEKIEENTIDEAFFVLSDGKLIVHSNTTIEKELMGNIANDEMSYNIELILQPVTKKSSELYISSYNIINKKIPFSREERDYLQKYYYKEINSSGWLFTRGVFIKGKPVGSVNFIISKDRIFNSIKDNIEKAKHAGFFVLSISFLISLIISLIVMFRYRSILKRSELPQAGSETSEKKSVIKKKAASEPLHRDEIIPVSQVNYVNDDFDFIIDDHTDSEVVEEPGVIFPDAGSLKGDEKPLPVDADRSSSTDDEYITIELLGEIDEQETSKPELLFKEGARVYIAPVINTQTLKKTEISDIRDAIPVSRKR